MWILAFQTEGRKRTVNESAECRDRKSSIWKTGLIVLLMIQFQFWPMINLIECHLNVTKLIESATQSKLLSEDDELYTHAQLSVSFECQVL